MKMDKDPKAKKSTGKISKSDWKKMPRNKQGIITNDTIKKTRAAKGAKPAAKVAKPAANGAKPAAKKSYPMLKSYPKLMLKKSYKNMLVPKDTTSKTTK